MNEVIVLRGIPGSGKSTLIKTRWPTAIIFSADSFFVCDGKYVYDPARAGEAHAWCLNRFISCAWPTRTVNHPIIVDNTNTTVAEFAPYAAIALAQRMAVKIVTLLCKLDVAAARNAHGVPVETIEEMHKNLLLHSFLIPKWWPHEIVEVA